MSGAARKNRKKRVHVCVCVWGNVCECRCVGVGVCGGVCAICKPNINPFLPKLLLVMLFHHSNGPKKQKYKNVKAGRGLQVI